MQVFSDHAATFNTTISEITAQMATIENELKALRTEAGATRSSAPADRSNKNVTGVKGPEKLRTYTGDATQWPDWRFNITTWLVQTNPFSKF